MELLYTKWTHIHENIDTKVSVLMQSICICIRSEAAAAAVAVAVAIGKLVYKLRLRMPRPVLPFHFRYSACRTFSIPSRLHCESVVVCVCTAFHNNNQWQLVHQQQLCYWFTYDFIPSIRFVPS